MASAGFIAIGVIALDTGTTYGALILIGLVLGAIGDMALLGSSDRRFVMGLGAFLLGHLAFGAAFASDLSRPVAGIALAGAFSASVWRWLGGHVKGRMRGPVVAYVAVITLMLATAIAAATNHPLAALGATAFAISDLAVARDRFVAPGRINSVWGLPLYYFAQVMIALSS